MTVYATLRRKNCAKIVLFLDYTNQIIIILHFFHTRQYLTNYIQRNGKRTTFSEMRV